MVRKLLVTGVITALVVALAVLAPLVNSSLSGLNSYLVSFKDDVRNHITVTLEVYKNNKLVVKKVGDPISDQWLAVVTAFLLGMAEYFDISWKYEDGTASGANEYEWFGTEYWEGNPIPKIAVGTGNTAYNSDYALAGKVMEQELNSDYISVSDTGSSFNITFAYSFDVNSDYNVSEVGLFIGMDPGSKDFSWILVAHDNFSTVILHPQDVLSIKYTFIIDYSKPPFLKTFWELLIDYFLGLRGAGCPVGSTRIDLGSRGDTYYYPEIKFAYVLSDTAWSPTITSYDASESWKFRKPYYLSYENQNITLKAIAIQEDIKQEYNTYGLMIYLYADTDPSQYKSYTNIPIAYIRFDNAPLHVDWMTYFDVKLSIQFNQG